MHVSVITPSKIVQAAQAQLWHIYKALPRGGKTEKTLRPVFSLRLWELRTRVFGAK